MSKKDKCSKTQKNRIVIHKDDKEKRIYKGQLDEYLNDGWKQGWSERHKLTQSVIKQGKEPWNKDTKGVMKANSGSFKKGQTAWNKELKKIIIPKDIKNEIINGYLNSDMTIKQLSEKYSYTTGTIYHLLRNLGIMRNNAEAQKGHIVSAETRLKISQANKHHLVSVETRQAVSVANKNRSPEQLKIQVSKSYLTKKKNNTFNTSKPENNLYKMLLKENVNKTILRQYKDERYPYYCDFYIKEDGLFIELNAHWTHGGHPFNLENEQDIKTLDEWKEKAKTSKFYQQAIYVWTELDVNKQKCAKENKLNYKAIY